MKYFLISALSCVFFTGGVLADGVEESLQHRADDEKAVWTVAWENDVWSGVDRHYTNGNRFAYLSPETSVPDWLDTGAGLLPFFARGGKERFSFSLGQSMFTPEDITQRALQVNDRPYAGWLYGTVGMISDTGQRLDAFELSLGIVGESALAEPVQETVHDWIDSPDPSGWDNQLKDEPAIMLSYERKWRGLYEFAPLGLGMDVTPHIGGSLGNVFTQAAAGATVRVGFDLPSDYGPPRIRPSLPGSDFFVPTQDLGAYVFAGFEGRAVAHNIFLDGNTFKDSHSVTREPFVGSLQAGAAITVYDARISYTHVVMTEEFDEQSGLNQFGAVTVSFRY